MDIYDETTKARCAEWSTGERSGGSASSNETFNVFHSAFKKECKTDCVKTADAALAASEYDRAIELYSAAINLDAATDTLWGNRCKAKLGKMSWEEALIDAQMVPYHRPVHRSGSF